MRFDTFLGVDQTGAVVGGRPRPLSAARLVRRADRWTLETALLRSASREDLLAFADDDAPAIALDVVLGLPAPCWRGQPPFGDAVWELLRRTTETEGYGRLRAEAFFAAFAPPRGEPLPRRPCEIVAKANSVLATRPFQKNVQTGTFRIWKDLTRGAAGHERWANLWPFDDVHAAPRRPWLFEGYPSFLWTRLFGFPRRSPARFAELIGRARALGVHVKVARSVLGEIETDADLADAAALAIGAACLDARGRLLRPFDAFASAALTTEGWIMGVVQDPDSAGGEPVSRGRASGASRRQRGSQRGGRRSK